MNIDNNKTFFWAAKLHVRMISEGSCDTEDWSNDAENSALLSYKKKTVQKQQQQKS